MLLAMLVNDKKLRLMIRVNAIPFSDPLIQRKSDDLSIFTIQHFVKIKQLNEGMVNTLSGSRGIPSQKLSSTVISKIGTLSVRHNYVITLRGNYRINDIVINALRKLLDMQSGDHIHLFLSLFFVSIHEIGIFKRKKVYAQQSY